MIDFVFSSSNKPQYLVGLVQKWANELCGPMVQYFFDLSPNSLLIESLLIVHIDRKTCDKPCQAF